MDVDIIAVDVKIQEKFKAKRENAQEYIKKIEAIKNILANEPINQHMYERLEKSLIDYENILENINSEDYNFYISESLPIIETYKKILRTPIKISFVGNNTVQITSEKEKLIHEFINIAKKHIEISHQHKQLNELCENCSKKTIYNGVCGECGHEKELAGHDKSYTDISRTNILQKYSYDRRTHFRDCINQYQGKQNCKIDNKIYDDIEQQLENHHLIPKDKTIPTKIRYVKIKKEHIMLFLKELNHDKHYENSNYIYSKLSGVKCPDISHLEEQLMADFDTVVNLYIKKFKYENKIERKSFMNIQYVFFQLLNKNKYKCKKEDFNILKTIDRKAFHDDVFKELFQELGWNHTPFF